MDIGPFLGSDVVDRGFNCIECANLHIAVFEDMRYETECSEGPLTVSISITVLNAFSDIPEIGAKKLPAAPKQKYIGFWK